MPGNLREGSPQASTEAWPRRKPWRKLCRNSASRCPIGSSTAATALLLVPFLAVLIGRQRVLPLLQRGKTTLLRRGELVVGSLSFGLGSYLSWQGISGLMIK